MADSGYAAAWAGCRLKHGRDTYLRGHDRTIGTPFGRLCTTWTEMDDRRFDVALVNGRRTVTGRVFVDDNGGPVRFPYQRPLR